MQKKLSIEAEKLLTLKHANITCCYDKWEVNGRVVFITELMTAGTLREYGLSSCLVNILMLCRYIHSAYQRSQRPKFRVLQSWCKQILRGLHYLHTRKPPIIHRDVKCDNIFINGSTGTVKIGDLGLAVAEAKRGKSIIGTPEYMAPEMYSGEYGPKVDVYAFGMSVLEMMTGEYPFQEYNSVTRIYKAVMKGIKPKSLSRVDSKLAYSFIYNCILTNPDERYFKCP